MSFYKECQRRYLSKIARADGKHGVTSVLIPRHGPVFIPLYRIGASASISVTG